MFETAHTDITYQPYPQPEVLKLDNSKRETFTGCPRKYFYTYLMGYKPILGSTALRYGVVWHKAMEGFYGHIAENGWTRDGKAIEAGVMAGQAEWIKYSETQEFYDDYRTLQNLFKSFMQYVDHFAFDEGFIKVIEPEQIFQIPIEISSKEKELFPMLKPFILTGKLDLAIEMSGQPWRMEFKTTGQRLAIQKRRLHRQGTVHGLHFCSAA